MASHISIEKLLETVLTGLLYSLFFGHLFVIDYDHNKRSELDVNKTTVWTGFLQKIVGKNANDVKAKERFKNLYHFQMTKYS